MLSPAAYKQNRVRFERRETLDDGMGNTQGGWAAVMTVWAAFRPAFGREQIAAGRLESGFPGTLTLRRTTRALGIDAAHRGVFTRGPYRGRVFQIRSIVPSPGGDEIEMTIEEGVAT